MNIGSNANTLCKGIDRSRSQKCDQSDLALHIGRRALSILYSFLPCQCISACTYPHIARNLKMVYKKWREPGNACMWNSRNLSHRKCMATGYTWAPEKTLFCNARLPFGVPPLVCPLQMQALNKWRKVMELEQIRSVTHDSASWTMPFVLETADHYWSDLAEWFCWKSSSSLSNIYDRSKCKVLKIGK